tara:strand:+ start:4350 stop:4550 length:201 start_codon:yes stop_codon:yes gene_type:complete
MNNVKRILLTTYQIRRKYEDTHRNYGRNTGLIYATLVDLDVLKATDFPVEDLLLDLNDFSKKQGWS